VGAFCSRNACITVSRQINQTALRCAFEEIDGLRAARSFADKRQLTALSDCVYGAGFSGVGAPSECYFAANIGRQFMRFMRRRDEARVPELSHRSLLCRANVVP